jgi:hypothetical protein
MGKIFPHRRHKARLSPPTWASHAVENDVERRERIARERESRQRLDDDRSRRMAERREKRARAVTHSVLDLERLANNAFPWPLIARECRLFDMIVQPFIPRPRDFPLQRRGLLWAMHLVFGEISFGALQRLHPSADQVEPDTWRLITDLCPVTTDWRKIVKVGEFFETSLAVIQPTWQRREEFNRVAQIEAATNRNWLAARIEAARAGRDGLSLTELGDGWFRVKDEAVLPLLWEKCGHPFGSYEQALARHAAVGANAD